MKKLFFAAIFNLIAFSGFSQQVVCSDFNVGIKTGIVNVSTTVYVCCGGPFMHGLNQPCSIVKKKTYDLWVNQSESVFDRPGVPLSELVSDPKVDLTKIKSIEVTKSTQVQHKDYTLAVKKGTYDVDKNQMVYLELEIL